MCHRFSLVVLFLLVALTTVACRNRRGLPTGPCSEDPTGDLAITCELEGWDDRAYDLFAPAGEGPFPLVFAIHGGGGSADAAARTACPGGDLSHRDCLHAMALRRGFAIVFPNGIGSRALPNVRTWNAGGGEGVWRCVGGRACEEDVDDVGYFRELVADIDRRLSIDRDRIYSTGLSNGGAMSHRLACEFEGLAAIVAVGGAMQFTAGRECQPSEPVAIMHVHGTEDPCWVYEGGPSQCRIGEDDKQMRSVEQTMSDWAATLNCGGETTESPMPDPDDDGVASFRVSYDGCDADLELIRMEGAGHTWPDGYGYLPERTIGKVSTDFGNEVIFEWFEDH